MKKHSSTSHSQLNENIRSQQPNAVGHTKVGDSIRHAGESIDNFSEKMGHRTDRAIHTGEKIASEINKKSHEYGEKAVSYVKNNPVKSTLIAGAVGLILGRIFKR